ncbi:CARDB domain-containing protein [Capillimicrobium parvum]|uniref:CARDB domain-containing protein n=1 Tax=Capillimicrobium parvum TaxID=2884022 RepID=A0A9E6XV79_9ACTN|nr:CARDB domain-containing protein [Capillimicrobium parvum]UGS35043.1 hypothetical protein DSM104329_01427 [Capillimicrobium parvum]
MRRLALIPLLLALAAPAAASAAPASAVSTGIDQCVVAGSGTAGSVQFRSRMTAVPRSQQMWVRFDLQARLSGDSGYQNVSTRDNGWIKSNAGVDEFIWHKLFQGLSAPGDYRARVRFRWLDADGKVVDSASRRTAVCSQPDMRPNLELTSLTAESTGDAGQLRYVLGLRNTGKGDSAAFDISFSVGGAPRPLVSVSGLPAGRSQTVAFVGDRCRPGEPVRLEADPSDRIAEVDEADNVLSTTCPAPVRR